MGFLSALSSLTLSAPSNAASSADIINPNSFFGRADDGFFTRNNTAQAQAQMQAAQAITPTIAIMILLVVLVLKRKL